MVSAQPQTSFGETALDSDELVKLLDDWQKKKDALKPVRKAFNTVNATVKEKIEGLELPDGTYRAGKYTVTIKPVAERDIEFTRTERRNISIKPAKT